MTDYSVPIEAEFMFGILGYSTWNIYVGDEWLGQVTLNAADKTVNYECANFLARADFDKVGSFASWMKFLRSIRRESRERHTLGWNED